MVIKHLWGKNPEIDPSVHVDVVHCHGIIKGDSKKLLFRDYTKFLEFILVVFHFLSVLLLIADFIWKLSVIRSCWKAFYVHGKLWGTFKFVLNFEVLIATWYFAYPYVFGVLRFIPSKFGIYIIFGNKSECEVVLETLRDNFLLNYILETSQPVESLFRLEVDQSHSVISSIDHIDVCGALSILYVNKTWSNLSIWEYFTRCLSLSSQFYRYTEVAECFNLTKSVLDNNDEKSSELHHNNPETSDNQSDNSGEKLTHWESFLCGTDRMAAYDPENQVIHIICHSIFNPTFPAMFIFPRIVPILLFISVVLNSFI